MWPSLCAVYTVRTVEEVSRAIEAYAEAPGLEREDEMLIAISAEDGGHRWVASERSRGAVDVEGEMNYPYRRCALLVVSAVCFAVAAAKAAAL